MLNWFFSSLPSPSWPQGRNGISLTTLAGPHGLMSGADAEFRLRFDRAMQARHLIKGHNLNIINPKEIMLHKIIGEGSFGRVWSGRWRSSSVSGFCLVRCGGLGALRYIRCGTVDFSSSSPRLLLCVFVCVFVRLVCVFSVCVCV